MNTNLPSYPFSASERALRKAIRLRWKTVATARQATASQHAAYVMLLGKDLDKAFTPIRNPAKITSCGCNPHWARDNAVAAVEAGRADAFAPWADLLTAVDRDTGWSKAYKGGFLALRSAMEQAASQEESLEPAEAAA